MQGAVDSITPSYKIRDAMCVCDKIFWKKLVTFHSPLMARYAS